MRPCKIARQRIIFNNYDQPSDEEIIAQLLDEGHEREDIDDELIWNRRYLDEELNWDEAKYELTKFFEGKTVGFFGSLGLWDGVHKGGMIGEFWNVYYKAIKHCDYIKIYDENGHLYLTCSHHDGTNHFEIKVLTDKGVQYNKNWEYSNDKRTKYDCHTQIFNRYSVLPRYAQTVYASPAREYESTTKAGLIDRVHDMARSNYS